MTALFLLRRTVASLAIAMTVYGMRATGPIRLGAGEVRRSDALGSPLGSMAEVTVAADPSRPLELAVAADLYIPNSRIRVAVSHNGGLSWGPRIDVLPPGFAKSFDPTVSFRADGSILVVGGASGVGPARCQPESAIFAASLRPAGAVYSIVAGPKRGTYFDRPASAIRRVDERVFITWTESTGPAAECRGVPSRSRLMLASGIDSTFGTPMVVPSSGLREPFGSAVVIEAEDVVTIVGAEHQSGQRSRLVVSTATALADRAAPVVLAIGQALSPRVEGIGGFNAPIPVATVFPAVAGAAGRVAVAWLLEDTRSSRPALSRIVVFSREPDGAWREVSPPPLLLRSPRLAAIAFLSDGRLALLAAVHDRRRIRYVLSSFSTSWTRPYVLAETDSSGFREVGETLGLVAAGDTLLAAVPLDGPVGTAGVFAIASSALPNTQPAGR